MLIIFFFLDFLGFYYVICFGDRIYLGLLSYQECNWYRYVKMILCIYKILDIKCFEWFEEWFF